MPRTKVDIAMERLHMRMADELNHRWTDLSEGTKDVCQDKVKDPATYLQLTWEMQWWRDRCRNLVKKELDNTGIFAE